MSRRDARRGQAGFSLVELLIALTVMVIGLLGLLSLHTTTMAGTQSSAQVSEAQTFGRELMEDMRAMSLPQIQNRYGNLPVTVTSLVSGRANQQYTSSITITELSPGGAGPDLLRMRVVVSWTEAGAVPGSDGGRYDHAISLELLRPRLEVF